MYLKSSFAPTVHLDFCANPKCPVDIPNDTEKPSGKILEISLLGRCLNASNKNIEGHR